MEASYVRLVFDKQANKFKQPGFNMNVGTDYSPQFVFSKKYSSELINYSRLNPSLNALLLRADGFGICLETPVSFSMRSNTDYPTPEIVS